MTYHLLTGATGLLGRYLMRDLTLADVPLAVVVRASKWESATQRIESAMARWESELGHALLRPVVLEGDIAEPQLGLSANDLAWVADNCQTVIHSAASLTFHADTPDGEPFRSNIQGTRNVIDLCSRAGIRQCHHVSTAYVCGLRRGRILETELDVGQQLGNDYERTKVQAENEVRASAAFDQVTVHRPSIIIGDWRTGFTTSYHGFYTPLRLLHSALQIVSWETILCGDWVGRLSLDGNERKNLVPVDWVSAVMTLLICNPSLHGRTYHLTNPKPATVASIETAIAKVLSELAVTQAPSRSGAAVQELVERFREQMKVYQSYWSDDPEFDSSATEAAAPHLPCPEITLEAMERLLRYAIGTNFGWPREPSLLAAHDVQARLDAWLDGAAQAKRPDSANVRLIGLHVSGPGGGQWHLAFDGDGPVAVERGMPADARPACYLTSATLNEIARGELTVRRAIETGLLLIIGNSIHPLELARLFRTFGNCNERITLEHATH